MCPSAIAMIRVTAIGSRCPLFVIGTIIRGGAALPLLQLARAYRRL
jgi:hypothetical protein